MATKKILITGGTGSFGRRFVSRLLEQDATTKLVVFSRDEMKQWRMSQELGNDPRVQMVIGDVRDRDALEQACRGVDILVHAAATKIVPLAESNPAECIKTNVLGAINVIDSAKKTGVRKVVALSTDKASNPINLYGASKLASDKLFVAANFPTDGTGCIFSVVRYGNVMGSRGSVIPFFMKLINSGAKKLPITDSRMTRFMITLDEGVDLVLRAMNEAEGGEIFVKKIPSMRVVDIAATLGPGLDHDIIGIRAGEKIHEQMISIEEARYTVEHDDHYIILSPLSDRYEKGDIGVGKFVREDFSYSSDSNTQWMTRSDLSGWLKSYVPGEF